jgi:hypothetical protein
MFKKLFIAVLIIILASLVLPSCKRTYFYLQEEVLNNKKLKFNTRESYYRYGQQIELTGGGFRVDSGDDILIYIKGETTVSGVGEPGIMTLEFREVARFYIALTPPLGVGKYDIKHKALCEIINSLSYKTGENLFTCQQGEVVIDSLKKDYIYGKITGEYLNTSNKRLSIEGNIKAKRD